MTDLEVFTELDIDMSAVPVCETPREYSTHETPAQAINVARHYGCTHLVCADCTRISLEYLYKVAMSKGTDDEWELHCEWCDFVGEPEDWDFIAL